MYVGRLRVGLKKGVELLRLATVEVMRSAGAGARDAGRCQSPDLLFRYRCCNRFLPDRFGAPKPTVILSDFRRSNHPFRNLEILCDFQNSEVHEIPQRSKNHAKLKNKKGLIAARLDFGMACGGRSGTDLAADDELLLWASKYADARALLRVRVFRINKENGDYPDPG